MTAKPTLTVLAGPTAVGKGTVCQYIREHYPAGVVLCIGNHTGTAAG